MYMEWFIFPMKVTDSDFVEEEVEMKVLKDTLIPN